MKRDKALVHFGLTRLKTSFGFNMVVNPYEHVGRYIFVEGSYEQEISSLFKTLVHSDDCVLDVGANIGWYTILAAKLVGPNGQVHAFEPDPPLASTIQINLEHNDLSNATVHWAAVSDTCGDVYFYQWSGQNMGLSSLRDLGLSSTMLTIASITLDSLLDTLPKVSLVKIDVEGAEYKVLKGMKGLLLRDKPNLILEVTGSFLKQLGDSEDLVFEFFAMMEYELYLLGVDPVVRIETPPQLEQYNMLALHRATSIA
jgi:FkbM family methyltransferase